MLGFESVSQEEKDLLLTGKRVKVSPYSLLITSFIKSGEDVAKVTGFSMTDAAKIYQGLMTVCTNTEGVTVSKRGETIYLLNKNVNPIACAPEKR